MTYWTKQQQAELANLYHLARAALNNPTMYERKLWASQQYAKKHAISSTAAYKELCRQGAWRHV